MAEERKAEDKIILPHVRASDFRHVGADGAHFRVAGSNVILTFYINDAVVTQETMKLSSRDATSATYKPEGVEERNLRTDLVSVRVPLAEFLEAAKKISEMIAAQVASPKAE